MLYREIIAVCSEIHTKHINTLCEQNVELYSVILWVLDPRKCKYLKHYWLDFEHAYMTTYLASWEACRYFFAALWQFE